MLKIYYGEPTQDNYIFNPEAYFDNIYEDGWITDETTKQMIKDIDKSEVVSAGIIDSPFLGPIPPIRLSGGVKTLILMNYDNDHMFNASFCGDNCAGWILRLGKEKDLTIRLGYLMNFGDGEFDIEIVNLNKIVHSKRELIESVLDNDLI